MSTLSIIRFYRLAIAWCSPLAVIGFGGVVNVVADSQPTTMIQAHPKLVRWIGFSPDGKSLVTASFDGSLQMRDAASGELQKSLTGHRDQVYWGSFSKDGTTFCSGGEDAVLRLWDLKSGKIRMELPGHQGAVWTGAVTPNGKRIVSGGPDAMVFIWDISTGKVERSFRHAAPVWWIDVSHNSSIAAIASGDGKVTLYDVDEGQALRTFGNHAGGAFCVTFSPDDSLIATAGADSCSKIWSAQNGSLKHSLAQFGPVYAVAFSPDGKQLATGGADYSLRLWNVDRGAFRVKRTGHVDAIWTLAFGLSGSHLASGGGDGKVHIWTIDDETIDVPTKLPVRVDLRPTLKKFGLPVVSQLTRNTCSVHTFTRALEFAVSKHKKKGQRLSDEYLNWASNQVVGNTGPKAENRGHFFEHLWMGYCKYGICKEAAMPFRQQFDPSITPSAAALKSVDDMRQCAFVWRDITGPGVSDAEVVAKAKSVLARGWPLLAGSAHSLFIVG